MDLSLKTEAQAGAPDHALDVNRRDSASPDRLLIYIKARRLQEHFLAFS
jgi:hypothetical protein